MIAEKDLCIRIHLKKIEIFHRYACWRDWEPIIRANQDMRLSPVVGICDNAHMDRRSDYAGLFFRLLLKLP